MDILIVEHFFDKLKIQLFFYQMLLKKLLRKEIVLLLEELQIIF